MESNITESRLDAWFASAEFRTMEAVFGLRYTDFDEEDGYQAFVDECERRWGALGHERKLEIYNTHAR